MSKEAEVVAEASAVAATATEAASTAAVAVVIMTAVAAASELCVSATAGNSSHEPRLCALKSRAAASLFPSEGQEYGVVETLSDVSGAGLALDDAELPDCAGASAAVAGGDASASEVA